MTPNQKSDYLWLQTAAERLKVQSVILICAQQMLFYYKTFYNRFVYFYWKIPGFDKKENCGLEKLLSFIWPSCWTPTIVWKVLRQGKHQGQQKDEIFSPRKL